MRGAGGKERVRRKLKFSSDLNLYLKKKER